MATNFTQPGDVLTLTAPTGGVVSGTPYLIVNLIVVALATVAETLPFPAAPEGVWTLPKATGAAWAEGDILYWDNSAKKFTKTSTANYRAGVAVAAAASGDATGSVYLNGIGVTAVGGAAP